MEELNRLSVAAFKEQAKIPVVVVLDGVRSNHNVGAVFRTGDAFRVEKIWLCGIAARPPHRDIQKTALGATDSVDWAYEKEVITVVDQLKGEGYTILAIEQAEGSVALENFSCDKDQKYALVFGHEVSGVSDAVMEKIDTCIEIPQEGTKHSLNISVSAGVVLWEFFRQLR